jgi:hypothetical protein
VIKINDYLLQIFIEKISKDDINDFARKQGVTLDENELDIIYEYLKKYWRTFYYGNPLSLLEELKAKLSSTTYAKIENLYMQAKERFS